MEVKIVSDRLGEQIVGSIFAQIHDSQKLVIRIPNSEGSKGLAQLSIYGTDDSFVSGIVIPQGYDHIEIWSDRND